MAGFNPAGIIALVLGSVTYQLLLNPVTYEPRSELFKYLTASLPALAVGAASYVVLSLVLPMSSRASSSTGEVAADRTA